MIFLAVTSRSVFNNIATGTGGNILNFPSQSMTNGEAGEYHNTYKNIDSIEEDIESNNKSNVEEGNVMDNNDLLSKYMDKVDQDRRDSDSRNETRLSNIEERMDNRLNRIEDNIKSYTESVSKSISDLDAKMDLKVSGMQTKMENKLTQLEGKIDNNNKFILGIAISTIIGIAAIVLSVLLD